jgi:hypothetical protein
MAISPWTAVMNPLVWSLAHAALHETAHQAMAFVDDPPAWATHAQVEAVQDILATGWRLHEAIGVYRQALQRFTQEAEEHLPPFTWTTSGDPTWWPEDAEEEEEDDGRDG